jgi:hypothetical protein
LRLPRIQFTLRGLLAAVAIAAVIMAAGRLWARRSAALALASGHEIHAKGRLELAEFYASGAAKNESEARRMRDVARDRSDERFIPFALACESSAAAQRSEEGRLRALSRYHDALRLKYERAARYPWLSIDSDPSPPE